ncbi:LOW QUALITY PROTEIN: transcription factor HES-5-like [Anableps anableps]
MKPAEIRFSLQRLQHRNPTMASTITAAMTNSQEPLTLNHTLRKRLVEKLRREQINSRIGKLKPELIVLPDSKLEKADILEILPETDAVQQQHPAVDLATVDQLYSRCVQEVGHFLNDKLKTQSWRKLLNYFNKLQSSSEWNLEETDFSSGSRPESVKPEDW